MATAGEGTKVLVTGATGYIATHIVQQLLQQGYQVRGTVRDKSNEKKVKPLENLCANPAYPLELFEADLTSADGWVDAVKGCEYVLHVASPFPVEEPKDENELIKPAVDGTLHVLKACQEAGGVKRVVVTSSVAAVSGGFDAGGTYSEKDWTDVDAVGMAYLKSKTLAEKAAWDFVQKLSDDDKFELATINPAYVMGPVLCGTFTTSMEVVKRMMQREMPMLPKLNFSVVDVRDVAAAHLAAMTVPEAAGQRHICSSDSLWMKDIALILDAEFKAQGYSIPTMNSPYPFIWLVSKFDKTLQMVLPSIGKVTNYDNTRMKNVLGVTPHQSKDTICAMAYSMVESGYVKKTVKYKGPPSQDSEM